MIRRDEGKSWLLISQMDHARIAGEIADVWGNETVPPLPLADVLAASVRHHDDGWKEWEAEPQVDPETGGPRNFTEMPMPEVTPIWMQSIEQAAKRDPLDGLWVSKHFTYLAEQARPGRRENKVEKGAIDAFLVGQKPLRKIWRGKAYKRFGDIPELEAGVEIGLKWLQFFDSLSLWLCCDRRTEPHTFTLPDGTPMTAKPQSPEDIVFDPWPLKPKLLTISTSARRIIAKRYGDVDELGQALVFGSPVSLHWRLKIV